MSNCIGKENNATVVRDVHLTLEMGQVLRREGIRQYSSIKPEIKSLIDQLLVSIDDGHLLEPAICYAIYRISRTGHEELSLVNNTVLHGSLLASALSDAEELVTVVCTIGNKVEKQVADYLSGGEPLRGLLLDGIGSAAVDSLVQEACKLIRQEASLRDYQVSSPFSPGIPGFPITEQWSLFKLAPVEEIGVSLTASGMMVPRKSASMVIGMGQYLKTQQQAGVCTRCNLRETCRYSQAG